MAKKKIEKLTEEESKRVEDNVRLVYKYVNVKFGSLPQHDKDDLYMDGMLGLIYATQRYDVDMGFEFSSYATQCIRGFVLRAYKSRDEKHSHCLSLNNKMTNYSDDEIEYLDNISSDEYYNIDPTQKVYEDYLEYYIEAENSILDKQSDKLKNYYTLYKQGHTYREIAQQYDISHQGVQQSVLRVKQKIDEEFRRKYLKDIKDM